MEHQRATREQIRQARRTGWKVACLRDLGYLGYLSNRWVLIDPSGDFQLYSVRSTERLAWDNLIHFAEALAEDWLEYESSNYAPDTDVPWGNHA